VELGDRTWGNLRTDGTFSDICFASLAWLIMTGHFRERETSRLSPSVQEMTMELLLSASFFFGKDFVS
jgi:hypothetical protein